MTTYTEHNYKAARVEIEIPENPKVRLSITKAAAKQLCRVLRNTAGAQELNDLYHALRAAGVDDVGPARGSITLS